VDARSYHGKAIQSAGDITLFARETRTSLVRDQQAYDVNIKLAQKSRPRHPPHTGRFDPGAAFAVLRTIWTPFVILSAAKNSANAKPS
jgi:hypothetical protein